MRLLEITAEKTPFPRGADRVGDPEKLSPFTRALLVADGTITDAVEAFVYEPLVLEAISQRRSRRRSPFPLLGLPAGSTLLDRAVALRGRESGKVWFLARTFFALDRIGPGFRRELELGEAPLGEILRRRAPGAGREILGAGMLRAPLEGPLRDAGRTSRYWAVRSYRLTAGKKALALVSEYLPERTGRARGGRSRFTPENGAGNRAPGPR